MTIKANSRLLLTSVVVPIDYVTGNRRAFPFVDLRERVTAEASDDRIVVTTASHTWATLSLGMLRDARHWWVIADLSGVVDPFTEFTDETRLRVPSAGRFLLDILPGEDT